MRSLSGGMAPFGPWFGPRLGPLVPAGLWRTRSLVAGVLVMLGATGILVATFFLNSLYLQEVQGASALRTGLAFLPVALVIGAGAHLAARLLPRIGSRVLIVAGLAVMGAGAPRQAHSRRGAGRVIVSDPGSH